MTWASISAALLALGCSVTQGEECACGRYLVEATQLDGKCGHPEPRETWLDCTMRANIGSSEYLSENGEKRVLEWDDWYDISALSGGGVWWKSLPMPAMQGEMGAWGTAEGAYGYGEPLCESHYSYRLTKLDR